MNAREAFEYCENIARTHYENFTVGSYLLPKEKKKHVYALYAFCRWADDLGDEIKHPRESLKLLNEWGTLLNTCVHEEPTHPVFIALRETIREFHLPLQPFQDLIQAFKIDQIVNRYKTFAHLLYYCRHSANPVGRIFLMLFGYYDTERFELSDATCTALQLANFWQDIAIDLSKGRIYVPLEDMARFQYSESDLEAQRYNGAFKALMKFEIQRTRSLFEKGLQLVPRIHGRLQLDVELFSRGGLKILSQIEKNDYNVFHRRPRLSKFAKGVLAARTTLKWMTHSFKI